MYDPTQPPHHIVDRPASAGWRRLGVGTAPFNVAAFVMMLAISSFVVLTPGTSQGASTTLTALEVSDGERPGTDPAEPPATTDPAEPTSTTTSTSTTTAPAAPTSTAAPAPPSQQSSPTPTTPPTTARSRLRPEARLTAQAASPSGCGSFATQPDAQRWFDASPASLAALDGDGDGMACEHLPGRPRTQPALPAIPTRDELLLPETRLYGVHTPNAPYRGSELDAFALAAGKAPNTVMFFQNLSQEYPTAAIDASWARGALPIVSFEPILQGSSQGQPRLRDIASGDWDDYFRRWATASANHGKPLAFRFAQEMNGNWYSWADGVNGNARGDFVRAWRHLHDLFAQAGADDVIWLWSVNRIDNLSDKSLSRVWPGSAYVDWVGMSGYYRQARPGVTPSFDDTFGATLAKLASTAPGKPVVLTEVGAGTNEAARLTWIRSFFAGLLAHQEVIGFSWFNDFKDGGDWRIQYSTATAAAFAAGVADARYGRITR